MTESATKRDARRQETAQRIARHALALTEAHGFEGFTMEDLAEAADVSRRTLFNYFPSKLDAVLGPVPVLRPEAEALFLAGGPAGHLLDDAAVLARDLLDTQGLDRSDAQRGRRLVTSTPRLLLAVHQRFEEITAGFADLLVQREGDRLSPESARLVIRLLVAVFDEAMEAFVAGDERPLPDIFDATLRSARRLLA